jgi:acyl-CoA dehydrogenase
MDVHGGKAVQLGPKNYAARGWSSVPIAITVEGANIMTRSLMIFGQGAIRCHPYVLKEMQALSIADRGEQLKVFDRLLFKHLGFGISNAVRSFAISLTGSSIGDSAGDAYTRRYYRKLDRYSASLALCADVFMGVLGGKLKFKEKLSARLGDVLSYLYIASSMLKQYEDNGRPVADRPFLAWGFHECMWLTQNALDGAIRNFPVRPVAWLLRVLVFPLGRRQVPPSDRLGRRVAALLTAPNEARDRLIEWVYRTPTPNNTIGRMNAMLPEVIAAEPIDRKFGKAFKTGHFKSHDYMGQLVEAEQAGVLNASEVALLKRVREGVFEFISVDDVDTDEMRAAVSRAVRSTASVSDS